MSSVIKKKLSEALEIGNLIEKENKINVSSKNVAVDSAQSLGVSSIVDVNLGDENGVYTIALSQDKRMAAVGMGSGYLQILDCATWERIRKIRTGLAFSLPLLAVKFYPCLTRNALFTAGSDGAIKVWNMDTFTHSETISEVNNEIMALGFSNNGAFFVTAGKDGSVRLYDSDNLKLLHMYPSSNLFQVESFDDQAGIPGHSQKIFAVKFRPDEANIFLTASWDHSIKIWDSRTKSAIKTIYGSFVCGDGLDISHNTILTASWLPHNALQLWDFSSGKLIQKLDIPTIEQNGEYLYCGRFWDHQYVVAGGSGTNDLKIIDVYENKVTDCVSGLTHPVQCVEVMEKHGSLICGTSRNQIRIAQLNTISTQ